MSIRSCLSKSKFEIDNIKYNFVNGDVKNTNDNIKECTKNSFKKLESSKEKAQSFFAKYKTRISVVSAAVSFLTLGPIGAIISSLGYFFCKTDGQPFKVDNPTKHLKKASYINKSTSSYKYSCALHAVLGEKIEGVYKYTNNNRLSPKENYINDLKEEILCNEEAKEAFVQIIQRVRYYENNKSLFDKSDKAIFDSICDSIKKSNKNNIQSDDLVIEKLREKLKVNSENSILKFEDCKLFLDDYCNAIKKDSYYFSTDDIQLLAALKKKNIVIVPDKGNQQVVQRYGKPNEKPIVIRHSVSWWRLWHPHYERCEEAEPAMANINWEHVED